MSRTEKRSDSRKIFSSEGGCTVKQLTAKGRSAVATVAVEGANALQIVDRFLQRANQLPLSRVSLRKICYGIWTAPATEESASASDSVGEGVVVVRVADQPAHKIEIHCHGGIAAVERIISQLVSCGCVRGKDIVESGASLKVAARIEDEARYALQHATTERAAMILLDQLNGALANEVESIITSLQAGRDGQDCPSCDQALSKLDSLLRTFDIGKHLTSSWQVVLGGPPNVGKSSLINAVLGFDRSIVFDQPGTTRDVVSTRTSIGGWPVELSDTAGLREIDCEIEQEGVARGREQLINADCVVLVLDASSMVGAKLDSGLNVLTEGTTPDILVLNKIDLCAELHATSDARSKAEEQLRDHFSKAAIPFDGPIVWTSAISANGVEDLLAAVATQLVAVEPVTGAPVLFTQRQCDLIEETIALLQSDLDKPSKDERDVAEAIARLTTLAMPESTSAMS